MSPDATTRTDANLGVNPGLMLTLGLCPLLVASTSLGTGFALGLATLLVLCVSGALASVADRRLVLEARVGVYFVISACAVAAVDLVMAAWAPDLHASVGMFLPLIVASGLVLARPETLGSSPSTTQALRDAARVGAGLLLALSALGAARELIGHGTLGAGFEKWFDVGAGTLELRLGAGNGLLLAILPPGAFLTLGLLLALRNLVRSCVRDNRVDAPAGRA